MQNFVCLDDDPIVDSWSLVVEHPHCRPGYLSILHNVCVKVASYGSVYSWLDRLDC
jgi:hypothetical protein